MRPGEAYTAAAMALASHCKERGVAAASGAGAAPLSPSANGANGRGQREGATAATGAMVNGAGRGVITPMAVELRLCATATKFEGKGDVSVRAATFPEGVEPHIGVVDTEVAVTEALRDDIAPSLFAPSSGVAGAVNALGTEVEEQTDRHRHARAALAATMVC